MSGFGEWRATLGEGLLLAHWPKTALREGVNWEELWVLEGRHRAWGELVRSKLVLARTDDASAVAYANHVSGRSPDLTILAHAVKEREIQVSCAAVALHIACGNNAAAHGGRRLAPLPQSSRGRPVPRSRASQPFLRTGGCQVWA